MQKSDVTVVESAILIGSGIEKRCHLSWFVTVKGRTDKKTY